MTTRTARVQQLIADAGRQGDVATLRALSVELPAYLEAHEPEGLRTVRVAAGKSFAEASETLQRLLGDIHTASEPHLPAEERAAYELAEALKPAEWAVKPNIEIVRQALTDTSGRGRVPGLMGWEQKSYLPVDGPSDPHQRQPQQQPQQQQSAPEAAPPVAAAAEGVTP
jgi:hypothetical protein